MALLAIHSAGIYGTLRTRSFADLRHRWLSCRSGHLRREYRVGSRRRGHNVRFFVRREMGRRGDRRWLPVVQAGANSDMAVPLTEPSIVVWPHGSVQAWGCHPRFVWTSAARDGGFTQPVLDLKWFEHTSPVPLSANRGVAASRAGSPPSGARGCTYRSTVGIGVTKWNGVGNTKCWFAGFEAGGTSKFLHSESLLRAGALQRPKQQPALLSPSDSERRSTPSMWRWSSALRSRELPRITGSPLSGQKTQAICPARGDDSTMRWLEMNRRPPPPHRTPIGLSSDCME